MSLQSPEACLTLRLVVGHRQEKSDTGDVEDEAAFELAVNPGIKQGTKFSVLQAVLFFRLVSCGR